MERIDEKLIKLIRCFFDVMIVLAVLYFLAGQFILPEERTSVTEQFEEFQADWVWVWADGTRVPVKVPGKCDAQMGERVVVETVLPEYLENNMYLRFWSLRQDMEIYVDGVLRQQYSTKDTRLFGGTSSAAYVFLRLMPQDAGKVLTVVTQSDSFYTGSLSTVYYGDRMDIWLKTFEQFGAEILVAFLMLILGGASVLVSIVLNRFYHKKIDLEYLGWGIVIAASWLLFNSMFRQLLFRSLSVISDLTFLMVMLLALPFLLYMNSVQKKRYQKCYAITGICVAINAFVCTVFQITNLMDFTRTIRFSQIVCMVAILVTAGTIICDICRDHIREYALIAMGIMGACLSALVQICMYFMKVESPFSGIVMAGGLIFLLVSAIVSTLKDIMQMEQEKREAVLSNQSKARFLANMSHEIRTPINAVLGMDEMILRESTDKNITEYALNIQSAGRSLLSLINDILDFSKIESGRMEIIPVEYELSSLLNDCYNMIVMRAKEKQLEFRVENDPGLPGRLYGDEIRIRQIIINLLTNAVKYTKTGSVTFKLNGEWTDDSIMLKIAVEDTGTGISKEDQEKLFQSFQRVDEQKNRNIEGTGLGLAIARQLVELMGGTISLESEYGKGSVFHVEIAQKVVSGEPIGSFSDKCMRIRQPAEVSRKCFRAPEGRALVVDDVQMNLKVIKGLLKDTGMQIDTALSGAECLRLVQEKEYHIIFLDHMMPGMDGIETLHELQKLEKNRNHHTPVIMLTANAIAGAKEEYLAAGFADYLSKPVRVDKLEKMIEKYLPQELLQEVVKEQEEEVPFLEKLKFLDAAMGLGYCGNDEELYREVLKAYLDAGQDACIVDYYNHQDWENYRIQAHGIKSTSLSIGASWVSEMAKGLEMAAKQRNAAYIVSHHEEFMNAYEELLENLRKALETGASGIAGAD